MGGRQLRFGKLRVTAPVDASSVESDGSLSSPGATPASLTWVADDVEAGVAAAFAAATAGLVRLRLDDACADLLAHPLVLDDQALELYNRRVNSAAGEVGQLSTLVRQDTVRLPRAVAAAIVDVLPDHHTLWVCVLAQTYRPVAPPSIAALGHAGAEVYRAARPLVHVSLMLYVADSDLYETYDNDHYSHSFLTLGGFTATEARARHPTAPTPA